MEENKSELVKHILSSRTFKDADQETRDEIINEIVAVGDLSKDDVIYIRDQMNNIPYLESLPYDVFANIVLAGNIRGKDLIYLCNASPKLNEYCNKPYRLADGRIIDQYLFRRLIEQARPGLNPDIYNETQPKEIYKQIVGDYYDLINLLDDILTVHGKHYFTRPGIFPLTLEQLLYRKSWGNYRYEPLLELPPENISIPADYDRIFWIKKILEAAPEMMHHISKLFPERFKDYEIDINAFSQKYNISLEEMLEILLRGRDRFLFGNSLQHVLVALENGTLTKEMVVETLRNYREAYREVLSVYLPEDEESLRGIIIDHLNTMIYKQHRELRTEYEHEIFTRNLSPEYFADKERLEQIQADLDNGVYDYLIHYVIYLHESVLDSILDVLTPVDLYHLT